MLNSSFKSVQNQNLTVTDAFQTTTIIKRQGVFDHVFDNNARGGVSLLKISETPELTELVNTAGLKAKEDIDLGRILHAILFVKK
ncbi:hypothetical protein [Maribacter sp. 2304DJ31-5]|uniref:hypothetical protein n=1 Tax=Maribacter sp. 2304DJ31-5 TaxID=3386273 RepID=UPI0039BC4977